MSYWQSVLREEVARLNITRGLKKRVFCDEVDHELGLYVANCGVIDANDLTKEKCLDGKKEHKVTFVDRND